MLNPLPPGWTPFAAGSWPPDGNWVEVLHPDGTTTPRVHFRQPYTLRLPPLFGTFDREVVGWRPAAGPFPRVPKEPTITNFHKGW